jgi:NADPH2:quinone reductase
VLVDDVDQDSRMGKHLGAIVIGATISPAKVVLTKANGSDHVLNTHDAGWENQVRAITGGKSVPLVCDSIGKATVLVGQDYLQPRGVMVAYGNVSGPVDPFLPSILAAKGTLFVTRPTPAQYTRTAGELQAAADDLFVVIPAGAVKITINQRHALKDAAWAQDSLTGKKTTGATV